MPTIRLTYLALLAFLAATTLGAQRPGEPVFPFSTEERYDASRVAPYSGRHEAIYRHIDANLDAHLANIQRWIRQPSISAQSVGITEMATLLRDDLRALGFKETALIPTDGHPGVWGYYDAGAAHTLVVYMMYDVQPVEENWRVPPFAAELVDTEHGQALMGRGATNQKGPERAFLNAISSIIAVDGKLPVNLMVLAEGEEELGSPHYPQLVDRFEARLRTADGVFFPFNAQAPDGSMAMSLGVKGILYMEMESRGGSWGGPTRAEIHGSYKVIVDAPAWRLTQALASLTSRDGNTIVVPNYYDGIRPPTLEEQRLINALAAAGGEESGNRALSVDRYIDGLRGRDLLVRQFYHPTLNINGIASGYAGEGTKTILPHQAIAKVDSRLPIGLSPDSALARIKRHLVAGGFGDIEIRQLSGYPAAQTSVEAPIIQAALSVYRKYGVTPTLSPRLAGSAPFYQFTERLRLPLLFSGMGYGTGAHAPNELMLVRPKAGSKVAGLAEIEKSYVDLLFSLRDAAASARR
ncbi:MAG: M20/M25/M40 family metallo-hydrolase [Gemmatimonadaceae bacterium]|nr:M20/M25/M40 family metallo-hydrolase [Gemmatimonadaceae bacterium]